MKIDWDLSLLIATYLWFVCFMSPTTMESVKSQKKVVSWWFYCGLWRLLEIYCYSLLLIWGLFVVYESNNYGIWKTRIMRWFHGVLLRFMKIDWDLSLLIVTYLWFVCGLWVQKLYGISEKIWWFHGDLLRFMKIDWDLLLLFVTYLRYDCGLWIQ